MTLPPALAAAVRRMGEQMGDDDKPIGPTEVVRRACEVLDAKLSIAEDDDEFVIRNRRTGLIERIRFSWDMTVRRPPATRPVAKSTVPDGYNDYY